MLYLLVKIYDSTPMQPRRQHRILRRFLCRIIILTNVVIQIMQQGSIVSVVQSMSLAQSSRRSHSVIPCIYQSNALLQMVTQTSKIMMMQRPFRRLVTNEVNVSETLLTRTMVHRMRLLDLKHELERRGLIISGINKLKRPDLVSMLLAEISKTSPDATITTTTNDLENGAESTNDDSTTEISGTQTPSSRKDDEELMKGGRRSVEQYPIHLLQFDPNTTYAIAAVGVTVHGKNGTGVGLVMRECNQNTIIWQAQKFYPGYRSIFESDYTAIVLALRFALQSFHLINIQLLVSNIILVNQIVGNIPVNKPTLQLLLGQVSQLLKEYETNGLVFQIADQENRAAATALAQNAHKTKKSFNLDEEKNNRLTADPMSDILGLHKDRFDLKMPKTLENHSDPQLVMKFLEFVNPNEVVINPMVTYTLRFDGGSRGNPGIAGAGMVLYDDHDREIWRGVKYLGHNMSNNLAEYSALNIGLSHASSIGIELIRCEGDSQLVVKQLNGLYKVKSDNLRALFHETQTLMKKFKTCQVHHIRREMNSRADELANQGKDDKKICFWSAFFTNLFWTN